MNLCIIHYNTPELTEALIKSINKHHKDCHIYIFDNSDKRPFVYKQDNLTVFDNTNGQIINFEEELNKYHNKGGETSGRFVSFRHCASVDKCFDLIDDSFILLDSDVLLKRDLSDFWDENILFVGEITPSIKHIPRLSPFVCFINVPLCKRCDVRYFDRKLMHGINYGELGNAYDTGAAFLYHTQYLPHKELNIGDYIIHYKGASWDFNNCNNARQHDQLTPLEWLDENDVYYKDSFFNTDRVLSDKKHPIIVSFTSWKERLKYLPEFFDNLKKQTVQPDKYILWLSSDEVSFKDVPLSIRKDKDLEIHWVKENVKSFKKFLTIEQIPEAYNIILDDDRFYHENTVKDLLDESKKHNDKSVIGFYCDICNPAGQPWGGIEDNDITDYKWINDSCVLYPPYMFPQEVFKYYSVAMKDEPLVSDECFIMPFLIYHKTDIVTLSNGLKDLNRVSPIINESQESALHMMFMTDKLKTNKKNQLIWNICRKLPMKYYNSYMRAFPKFGSDIDKTLPKERIIVTMTSWKQRIGNVGYVLNTLYDQTMKPDKIVLNLSVAEFPDKEKELPQTILDHVANNGLEIHWVEGPNIKQWKKVLPTLRRYPNDAIIGVDDDFIYPSHMIETLWKKHVENPDVNISGNKIYKFGCKCHCGCASLVTYHNLNKIFDYVDDDLYYYYSDDIFYTYAAYRSGHPYIYSDELFFINMPKYNEVSPLHDSFTELTNVDSTWNYLVNKFGDVGSGQSKPSIGRRRKTHQDPHPIQTYLNSRQPYRVDGSESFMI